VSEYDREVSTKRRTWPTRDSSATPGWGYIHIYDVEQLVVMNYKFEKMRKKEVVFCTVPEFY
jgi:hypothetical protein